VHRQSHKFEASLRADPNRPAFPTDVTSLDKVVLFEELSKRTLPTCSSFPDLDSLKATKGKSRATFLKCEEFNWESNTTADCFDSMDGQVILMNISEETWGGEE
jgi:hypothetical protein